MPSFAGNRPIAPASKWASPGSYKIDDHPVGVGGDGESGDVGDAARAAGMAAVHVQAIVVGLLTLHLHVVAPGLAVGMLGTEKLVVDDAFELLGETGLARQPQQLRVQLRAK